MPAALPLETLPGLDSVHLALRARLSRSAYDGTLPAGPLPAACVLLSLEAGAPARCRQHPGSWMASPCHVLTSGRPEGLSGASSYEGSNLILRASHSWPHRSRAAPQDCHTACLELTREWRGHKHSVYSRDLQKPGLCTRMWLWTSG